MNRSWLLLALAFSASNLSAQQPLDEPTQHLARGKDERLRADSFYTGVQFYHLYLKALMGR